MAVNANTTTRGNKYILAENITLASTNWSRIGTGEGVTSFSGSFDGNGKTISNLIINSATTNQGLFGVISASSVVKNLTLLSCDITGASNSGSVVGNNTGGKVLNCVVAGTSTVRGTTMVGGIVGINSGATALVQGCQFSGDVIGSATIIGGVVGNKNSGTVQNCYATGSVSGSMYVGGVIGSCGGSGTGAAVKYCYSTAIVSASNTDVGGVVGNQLINTTVQSCVALNPSVTTTFNTNIIGRVTGNSAVIKIDIYARNDMAVSTTGTWTPAITLSGKDGADVSTTAPDSGYNAQTFWQNTMGWDFGSTWMMSGGLPVLQ
jgi:hypothetical protein